MKITPPTPAGNATNYSLPSASFTNPPAKMKPEEAKKQAQESSACLRILCNNPSIYEPGLANELCLNYLHYVDAFIRLYKMHGVHSQIILADLLQAVLMVPALRQQSSVQGQTFNFFKPAIVAYAADLAYKIIELTREAFNDDIVINKPD